MRWGAMLIGCLMVFSAAAFSTSESVQAPAATVTAVPESYRMVMCAMGSIERLPVTTPLLLP